MTENGSGNKKFSSYDEIERTYNMTTSDAQAWADVHPELLTGSLKDEVEGFNNAYNPPAKTPNPNRKAIDTEPDEVGMKFCTGMAIISGKEPDKCLKAWERLKSETIQEDTFNEYLDGEYGKGNAHTIKEIILALMHRD